MAAPLEKSRRGFDRDHTGSHFIDPILRFGIATGYTGWGYETVPGRRYFLSPDSLGHAVSPDLYSYCAGDGVNGLGPDGRGAIEAGNSVNTIRNSGGQPVDGPYLTVTGVGITTQGNNPENIPQASSSQGQTGSTVIVQGGISGVSNETSAGDSSSMPSSNPSGDVGLYIWGLGEPAAPADPFAYTESPYEQYLAHAPPSPVATIGGTLALNLMITLLLPEAEPGVAVASLPEIAASTTLDATAPAALQAGELSTETAAATLNQTYELGLQSSQSTVLAANRAIYDDFVANGGQLIQQRSVLQFDAATGEQVFGSYSTVNNTITLYQGSNLGTLSEELIHFSQVKNAGYLYQAIPAESVVRCN